VASRTREARYQPGPYRIIDRKHDHRYGRTDVLCSKVRVQSRGTTRVKI
jgi:hypothetical protein